MPFEQLTDSSGDIQDQGDCKFQVAECIFRLISHVPHGRHWPVHFCSHNKLAFEYPYSSAIKLSQYRYTVGNSHNPRIFELVADILYLNQLLAMLCSGA